MSYEKKGLEICKSLESLMPELNHSQETHKLWRDCDQHYRDANPSIGNKKFHNDMVKTYQTRIDTIRSAIIYIQESQPIMAVSNDFVDRCKALVEDINLDLDKPL